MNTPSPVTPSPVTTASSPQASEAKTPPVRFGVLGTANIALQKVIPAMQASDRCRVVAIASRSEAKARDAAERLSIPRAYGSYEELLTDPDVDAVYNPLPNHLHVPWSIRAAVAGKHVLCEKPIALSAAEARLLRIVRDERGVQIGEAFMVRTHPQWARAREIVASGDIGELRFISGHFSYFRRDPDDVRNNWAMGGGALLDVGCYPIMLSRWLFGAEPEAVIGQIERDPDFLVDRLVSALLRFPNGQASFTCAGQLVPHQRMQLFGTKGRIEVEIPYNAPRDRACRLLVDDGTRFAGESGQTIVCPAADQYLLQAEQFADAVRGVGSVPVSLEDAIANMAVIDAVARSAETGKWESPERA